MTSWHPDYLLFNDSIVQESAGSPRWATLRMNDETSEVRQPFRARPLWSLDLSGLLLTPRRYEELVAFQWEVKGMLRPFLIRNARNCLLEGTTNTPAFLGVGDGQTTTFQLRRVRQVQGRTNFETVRFPNYNYPPLESFNCGVWNVLPPLAVRVNGVLAIMLDVNRSTGMVRLDAAPPPGTIVTATGGFYTLMVANVDEIPVKPKANLFEITAGVSFSEPAGGE